MSDKIDMPALRKGVADFRKQLNAYKRDRARRIAMNKSRDELIKAGSPLSAVANHDKLFRAAWEAEMAKHRKKPKKKVPTSKKVPKMFLNKKASDA